MTTATKAITTFAPESIELVITGTIDKNTLPVVREQWKAWLDSIDTALETDEEIAAAKKSVAELKRTEKIIDELKTKAVSGEIKEVLSELDSMSLAARCKRLSMSKAIETQGETAKATAIDRARATIETGVKALKYCPDIVIEDRLRAAIKGKSSLASMQAALKNECNAIIAEATQYSARFTELRGKVAKMFSDSDEGISDAEIDSMVSRHSDGAIEQALAIIKQRDEARQKAAEATKPTPAPVPTQPKVEPVVPQPIPATMSAAATAPISPSDEMAAMEAPVRHLRFGVSFDTAAPAEIHDKLEALGGRRITFVEDKAYA